MGGRFEGNKNSYNISTTTENDSILDFKSPEIFHKTKLIEFNNFNICKKRKAAIKSENSSKNHKDIKSKQKSNLLESEPKPESSFFKVEDNCSEKNITTNTKVALVCPLCFKTFKDLNSRTLHMKICAYKKNIPTKKLLDAIELQKRQEDERKSLGLPTAPVLQDKKKSVPRKTSFYEESNLQLALALSKSLQEAEELGTVAKNEASFNQLSNQFISEENELIYEGQLEKFGFASNKLPSFTKNKRRKNFEVTLLQTRSSEERNHILTEKISEILMGDEPITQNQKEEIKCNRVVDKETILNNYLLQKICNKEEKLWDKAKLTSNQKYFYVPNLSKYITPEEKQIAEETILEFTNTCNVQDVKLSQYKIETCNNEEEHATSLTESCFTTEKCENCRNKRFVNTVITNWANALNNSSASDIIIFVNDEKYIWAHKLVFYVQCSNILLDTIPNDISRFTNIKEKICWTDIPYNIALAFLEFIYCGVIRKYLNVFENLTSFSYLRSLARKYKVKELFTFLQEKEKEIKQEADQTNSKNLNLKENDNLKLKNDGNAENLISNSKDFKMNTSEEFNEKYVKDYIIDESEYPEFNLEKSVHREQLLQKEICLRSVSAIRNCNASPDLFDDINDVLKSEEMVNKINQDQCIEIQEIKIDEDCSTSNSVTEVRTEAVKFSQVDNTSFKNTVEITNLSPNSVYVNTPRKRNHSNIIKSKSNLSLFISQFQVENARSDFDSDSETVILSTSSKLCRNPFNVKQHDSSNEDCVFTENIIEKTSEKEQDNLNIFDRDTNSNLSVKVLEEEDDSDISLNLESVSKLDVEECSMKYEKKNSADKDRNNAAKELPDEKMHSICKDSVNGDMENLKNSQNLSILQRSNNENIFSDFDTDEDDISMYSKYKKRHENNSIIKYRDFAKKHTLESSVNESTISEYRKNENLSNNMSLLSTGENFQFTRNLVKEHNNLAELKDLCNSTDECVINEKDDYLSTNIASPISSRENIKNREINKSKNLRCSKSESNIDVLALKQKSLVSIKQNANSQVSLDSSILVPSSPESESNILNMNKCEEHKTNKNTSDSKKFNNVLKDDIYLANVYIDGDDNDINLSPYRRNVCKLNEEIATVNENDLIKNNKSFTKRLSNEGTLIANQSIRKFQRKSISEINLYGNSKGIKNDVSKFSNNFNNSKCKSYTETLEVASPEIIRDNVTPPPNYNEMKTPELHEELNKYGLKIQKRKRATKLLTHIYDELHPTIFTTSKNVERDFVIISNEEDEPPMKKINYKQNDVDDCQLPLSQEIDEEKQSDKEESMPAANNTPDIKDVFLKLLTVKRELHNKILTYEPLCINSLHSMLKAEGFRCKMNTLMNFLDEQCITFYCQETKQKKDKLIFA